jgi:hypothetical protein
MSFTLYEHDNYGGCYATRTAEQNQGNCEGDALGRCNKMPCADNCGGSGCWGFGDRTSSLKVEDGAVLYLYEHQNYEGKKTSFRGDWASMPGGWNDSASSWEVKKDCNHEKWLWDSDCESGRSNTENSGSIQQKRQNRCNNADLNSDGQCRNWCWNNQGKCENSLSNYCNNKDNVTNSNCKKWCTSGKCDIGAAEFCKNNLSNDSFCGCYDDNAKAALPQNVRDMPEIKNSRAICFSSKCISEGYVPRNTSILTSACPKCIQSIDFGAISTGTNSSVLIDKINQSCGGPSIQSITNPNTPNTPSNTTDTNKKISIGLLIALILFVISIILIYYLLLV